VKMLLARGADTSYSADYDDTAYTLARKRGVSDVTRLLAGSTHESASGKPVPSRDTAPSPAPVSKAVEKAMSLLEKQSYNFIRTGGCNSCHSQDLPSAAAGIARTNGLSVPSSIPQLPELMQSSPERIMDLNVVTVASVGWELFDKGMNHAPKSDYTDAIVHYIKAMQTPDGHWSTNEGRRPPMNAGDFQGAALSIYALKQFGPAGDKAGTDAVIAKAVSWLQNAKPSNTQDRAFHLLGLAWGGGASANIREAARALAAMQQSDGGWRQLSGMGSDAYATGEVLYALNAGGKMAVTDPIYRKGVEYLLRTQAADGSWHVPTRAIWFQPYFESGFPYGRDQFISTAGTAWASMALAAAAEREKVSQKRNQKH